MPYITSSKNIFGITFSFLVTLVNYISDTSPQPTHPIQQQAETRWMNHRSVGWAGALAPRRAPPTRQLAAAKNFHLFSKRESAEVQVERV